MRPAAMATGSGWGMEGSRGTLEGYITLLVQHNPHTHTPLHSHTILIFPHFTSLTSSHPHRSSHSHPPPRLHNPHILTRSKQFLPCYIPQCVHICHTRVLVVVHLNEPPPVQLDPRLVNPKVYYVGITSHGPEEAVNTRDLLGLPLLCVGNEADGEGVARLLDFTNLWGENKGRDGGIKGGREAGREGGREGGRRKQDGKMGKNVDE